MKKTALCVILAGAVIGGCGVSQKAAEKPEITGETPVPRIKQPEQIRAVMAKVADWQLANPSQHHPTDWTHGAMYAGFAAWAQMADDAKYDKALREFGEKNNWQPGRRVYHADDHAVGQMYLEMYKLHGEPRMIEGIRARFDEILANRSTVTLKKDQQQGKDRWWWCDALFMAPPVWMNLAQLTGEKKYFDFMNEEWWATTDYLYDAEEQLYFRDDSYFTAREKNGAKVFWSRGNGWVLAGLVRVLEAMPADCPERAKYKKLYKEMAAKLIAIQPADGMWRPSLLDPESYPVPESSGTGFFCYGLAWGINRGLLDEKTYGPAVMKAWQGLNRNVLADGKLGYVQQIGADPRMTTADQTENYGVGAFLLAGSEVYKMAVRRGADVMLVTVTNPITAFRKDETVSVEWPKIEKEVKLTKDEAAVFDFKTNKLLVNQTVDFEKPAELLYQTNLAPGEIRSFWVMKKPAMLGKPKAERTTYCRFIPERKDDFGWENDKAAYRIYGPALEYETITSGIDAWGKSAAYPVIDKFIKAYVEQEIPYHEDHGEGGDFYKVGPTLGCGGLAPFVNGKIVLPPHNFVEHKVLANGPLRSVFEVRYGPWEDKVYRMAGETKRYSIDLGSNLSKIECTYSAYTKEVSVAAGIILRENSDKTWSDERAIAYWVPTDFITGNMGCGVVFGPEYKPEVLKMDNHLLLTLTAKTGEPIAYYSGSCWDKNEEFNTFEKWQDCLRLFRMRLDNPVKICLE